ncbi:DUF115 domain-containing protein [Clostridium bowmanii]|uniref:motility associated factor glycosyltransferase family protein n=1 Tax=Clostridium bowmanii TaxID=132925 RepID=UPI001C0C8CB8|nr:6-hydroxymethylpterin diphosphokinase MptE-like protein [Clostridium bowmanii]MBU3190622.1 DUF115 domain-containing protein [Clostridium bowmanii]MCA1075155.1 DUF115 domain-containing protein [Clostridium bowmanii]
MEMYEKNLRFFKENLSVVYEDIMREQYKYNSLIYKVGNGKNLLVEHNGRKCYIHSIYDTNREVDIMFKGIDRNTKNLLIFGIGCGYAVDYIVSNFKKLEKVIIVEPDLNLFITLLNFIDVQGLLLKLKHITFIINKTYIEATSIIWSCLSAGMKDGVSIVYNISYRTLYPGYLESVMGKWSKYLNGTKVNIATNDSFLYTWPVNIFRNIKQEALPIEELIDKFGDIPIILVSAGPSLNKNMHLLKKIKNKAIIVAVGSAIKILDSNGINPHYRFAIDGGDEEENIFKNIDTYSSTLVFSDEFYYKILPKYKGKKVRMVLDTTHLLRYMQKDIFKSKFTIKSGFSVANVALDAFIKLGFKKIIFIGQDLCYTEDSLYAKGSWTSEKIDVSMEKYIKTKDVFNKRVYTDSSFMGMKSLFEDMIEMNSEIEYINSTEGGLYIEGTSNKTFEHVMREDLLKEYDIEKIITDIYEEYNFSQNSDKIYNTVINVDLEINELLIENEKRIKILKKINRYKEKKMGVNRLISELDYVKSFEDILEKNSFYKVSLKNALASKFSAIYANFYYSGTNKIEELNSRLNIEFGKALELEKYLKLLKSLIEEFKTSDV